MSVPDAIGIALDEWLRDKQGVQQELLNQQQMPFNTSEFRAPGAPSADEPPRVMAPVSRPVTQNMQADQVRRYDDGQHLVGACPDCSSQLEYAEGCVKCHVCGFSECG